MSDDATQPRSSFYSSFSRSFAKFTYFIDENIRVIQYGVYCTGVAGVIIALHSVRAFTKFSYMQDIPREFITKHVRLHGHVRWVGVSPPEIPLSSAPTTPTLSLPAGDVINQSTEVPAKVLGESESVSSSFSTISANADTRENGGKHHLKGEPERLSTDKPVIVHGTGELRPRDNGINPDVTRIEYDEELLPIYLQVDHTPAISFFKKRCQSLLPLHLADVEVSKVGFQLVKKELMDQRVWFTLVSHDEAYDTLVAWVRPTKFSHRRSINERLLREGLALTGPMDLDLHHDKQYVKQYVKLLKAQEYAEKKKLGLWKPPPQPPSSKGIFRRVFAKLRAVVGRKK